MNDQNHFHNNSFMRRYKQNVAAKLAIAREAALFVMDGDSILLDASSTAYYLARELSGRNKLRVMTNGFEVARELAENTSNAVILIGGVVNNDSSSVTGLLSEQIIAEMHIEKAFFSCSGFSMERGMTEVHFEEAQLKRKAIEVITACNCNGQFNQIWQGGFNSLCASRSGCTSNQRFETFTRVDRKTKKCRNQFHTL